MAWAWKSQRSHPGAGCIITSDQVTLDIPSGAGSTSISVTDGTGAVVREQIITTPGRQQIELADLPVGMYLITVATADGFAAQRVMLVR
ncbi:MAG: T9SS type A sorting domain-containing protein [Flavobacteriales bacterium]|nr:T9SS type A sorting domain-containing protein [Flavobacteriales bacterium]